MGFKTKMIAVFITISGTLNCKLCADFVPKFKDAEIKYSADARQVKLRIDELFKIYDYVEHLDFTGGEPLLWDSLAEYLTYASRYRKQFKFLRIVTNGTLLPSKEVLSAVVPINSQFNFYIDNYGALSKKVNEIKYILDVNQISHSELIYHGEKQHCSGWIDYGDLNYKGYSDQELNIVYKTCMPAHNMCLAVFDGHLYNCAFAATRTALGRIPESEQNESIPLLDQSVSLGKKLSIAERFGKRALTACQHCNGFDAKTAKRFPAAGQA